MGQRQCFVTPGCDAVTDTGGQWEPGADRHNPTRIPESGVTTILNPSGVYSMFFHNICMRTDGTFYNQLCSECDGISNIRNTSSTLEKYNLCSQKSLTTVVRMIY